MPTRNALAVGYVRIDSTNNVIRAKIGAGVATDYSLTAGLYWLGIDCDADSGSLLDHVRDIIGPKFTLEHPNSAVVGSPGRTGHVWVDGTAGDVVYWGHANTTADPRWFGVMPTSGAYPTTTLATSTWEDISQASSSLVFCGDAQIRDDRSIEQHLRQTTKTDSGKVFDAYFGTHRSRYLEFRDSGLPRDTTDNDYQSMRRFVGEMNKGAGFVYMPDTATTMTVAWGPDDTATATRWGYQRFKLSPRNGPVNWDDAPMFQGYANHWRKGFFVDEWVA